MLPLLFSCQQQTPGNQRVSPKHILKSEFYEEQDYSHLPQSQLVHLKGCGHYEYYNITQNAGRLQKQKAQKPMRYNEVQVTQNNEHIQTGHTNEQGCFDLVIPRSSQAHRLSINTRARSELINISVLEQPENTTANYYFVEKIITPTQNYNSLQFKASSKNLQGAPFFIFDQIVEANQKLRQAVCPKQQAQCLQQFNFLNKAFSKAQEPFDSRLNIFWQKGFNPADYNGGGPPVSYYLNYVDIKDNNLRKHRIFILGGEDGYLEADTDHWDASVIVHEYAHYLENRFSLQHSPGGVHMGLSHIDPRVSWSEGWANFFQAFVLNSPFYIDTSEADTGSSPQGVAIDLENTCTELAASCYSSLAPLEGHFREFAVSRFLWALSGLADSTTNRATSCPGFAAIWKTLTSPEALRGPYPNRSSNTVFGDTGLFQVAFNKLPAEQLSNSQRQCWQQVSREHGMAHDAATSSTAHQRPAQKYRREFAYLLQARPLNADRRIASQNVVPECVFNFPSTGSARASQNPSASLDLLRDYDFFHYTHQNSGRQEGCEGSSNLLSLKLQVIASEADLDLYVYQARPRAALHQILALPRLYLQTENQAGSFVAVSTARSSRVEQFDVCLPRGDYLIVVAGSNVTEDVQYKLHLNPSTSSPGPELCHTDTVLGS